MNKTEEKIKKYLETLGPEMISLTEAGAANKISYQTFSNYFNKMVKEKTVPINVEIITFAGGRAIKGREQKRWLQ